MNDDERLLMLLQIIRINGNIVHLENTGWTYIDILQHLDKFLNNNLIKQESGILKLTSKGEKYFNRKSKELKQKGLYKYFKPNYDAKIIKLGKDEIYLPEVKEIKKIWG